MQIAISIDLCGSTQAKISMQGQSECRRRVERLMESLIVEEIYFHAELIRGGIPAGRIFVDKTLGDEVWILVNVPDDEQPATRTSTLGVVVEAACQVVRRTVSVPTSTAEEGVAEELPLKVFVDILQDELLVNVADVRFQSFMARADFIREKLSSTVSSSAEIRLVIERFAGFVPSGPTSTAVRTDYVGPEVDRFFRCCGQGVPFIATLGESLLDSWIGPGRAGDDFAPPWKDAAPKAVTLPTGPTSYTTLLLIRESLSENSLKGIPGGYRVYRVLAENPSLWPQVWSPRPSGEFESETAERLREWGLLEATYKVARTRTPSD